MSRAAYASPLVLEPGNSRYLIFYLIVVHVLALTVLVSPLNLPVLVRFTLVVMLGINFTWYWYRLRLNDPARIVRLVWQADDDWTIYCNDSTEQLAQLRPETYETRWLVILHWQLAQGGRRSLIILPDMLERQCFRRLRVRLRQARLAETADETGV